MLAGNIFLVFVFWELVGICSYFLIGFYIERKSASNAANKAFIVRWSNGTEVPLDTSFDLFIDVIILGLEQSLKARR